MCGLAFAHDFNGASVNNGILQLFDLQRSRGTEGFGYYDATNDHLVHAATEDRIINQLCKKETDFLLFHHRRPTSTINVRRAAHPFTTKDYFGDTQYILAHNGHVSNSRALKEEHEKLGITYHSELDDGTFNDSESLLWDVALTLEGKQDKLKAYGGIAFICLKREQGEATKLLFGRNTSPLTMYRDKDGIALASENAGEMIDSNTLYTFNLKLKRLTHKTFDIPTSSFTERDYTAWRQENSWSYTGYSSGYTYQPYDPELGYAPRKPEPQLHLPYTDDYDPYEDEYELYTPSETSIESKALEYILMARGNCENALGLAEMDYEELYDDEGYSLDNDKIRLMEHVLIYLETDPNYTSSDSISQEWSALCPTN